MILGELVGFRNQLSNFLRRSYVPTVRTAPKMPTYNSTFNFSQPLPFATIESQRAVFEAEKAQFYRDNPPTISFSYSPGFTGDAYAQKLLNSGTQNLVISHYKKGKAVYALQTIHIDQKPFPKTFNPTLTRL